MFCAAVMLELDKVEGKERPSWVCVHFGCDLQQHGRVGIWCSLLNLCRYVNLEMVIFKSPF